MKQQKIPGWVTLDHEKLFSWKRIWISARTVSSKSPLFLSRKYHSLIFNRNYFWDPLRISFLPSTGTKSLDRSSRTCIHCYQKMTSCKKATELLGNKFSFVAVISNLLCGWILDAWSKIWGLLSKYCQTLDENKAQGEIKKIIAKNSQ